MARNAHKKNTVSEDLPSWGELIGGTLAYAQDTVDSVVNWGFHKLRETAEKPRKSDKPRHPAIDTAATAARATAGFIGEIGESFYATYDALKEDKRKKSKTKRRE
ncbi:MAG: hypothetical protein CO113_03955 [Elusimicrobia bacterium CG_4_9_14_3_um_filter_62_55]|nr:MAG: hypothetical protein COR54_02080 [Elusimicrobia bacterium CG22_combo_CG10-13_8_21_14_all_63_91]PJA16158.1 MAG: hypothetical protein COX66_08115 [Elusimicrobia bacterium CG_4_10_14_0_2_um_filter_63_34]PJB26332.1 MAG: hypothetical protein CO113_03955 [Elusimicrobia bacterium CG_4_9_14_3_um_filter_62_55]